MAAFMSITMTNRATALHHYQGLNSSRSIHARLEGENQVQSCPVPEGDHRVALSLTSAYRKHPNDVPTSCRRLSWIHRRASCTDVGFPPAFKQPAAGGKLDSRTVATRAGFIAEGLERKKLQYGAERFDVETHARLRTDLRPDMAPIPTVR